MVIISSYKLPHRKPNGVAVIYNYPKGYGLIEWLDISLETGFCQFQAKVGDACGDGWVDKSGFL